MDAIDYSWELGERAAKKWPALFKKPNDLELEKVYMPYFLYSKKRYPRPNSGRWVNPVKLSSNTSTSRVSHWFDAITHRT